MLFYRGIMRRNLVALEMVMERGEEECMLNNRNLNNAFKYNK